LSRDTEAEHQARFDAVLKRMLNTKPISKAEISAKIKAEREAKRVQKMDKPHKQTGVQKMDK